MTEVIVAGAKIEVLKFQIDTEARGGGLEHPQAFWNDFLADAVTRNDCDAVLAHAALTSPFTRNDGGQYNGIDP